MNSKKFLMLAEDILSGITPGAEEYGMLSNLAPHDVFACLPGADMIRDYYFGRGVQLCTIVNGKSGRCTEDCNFCSQSAFSRTEAPAYSLMEKEDLQKVGRNAYETPISRYSIVTSGKRLPRKEVIAVAEALAELDQTRISTCASLGILDRQDFEVLKKAGVTRYHHNLETAESNFERMCTTHTYRERVDAILAAKEAGLSLCVGGVFGIGETDEQVLELALALRNLDVDAIPVNFLVPVKGTPAESYSKLTPLRCLKTISLFRYVLPDKDIIICGGREANLKELHSLIFYAGASGIMTQDYLTTTGRTLKDDLDMIDQLAFSTSERRGRGQGK